LRGTTAGGTDITITGTTFSDTKAEVSVTIDNVDCPVKTSTTTEIVCTTGARPTFV
jgi:hypothetical protein